MGPAIELTLGVMELEKNVFGWHGQEFVSLSDGGRSGGSAADQTRDVLERMDLELRREGASLVTAVRSRLWARDSKGRDRASRERANILSGLARSASSSYVASERLHQRANVFIDLIAMKPASGLVKIAKEYDPPVVPVRYVAYGPLVHLSGVTSTRTTLDEQVEDVVSSIAESLLDAGSSWSSAVKVSIYLQRDVSLERFRLLFQDLLSLDPEAVDYDVVDGYSTAGKLMEIEVTALLESTVG